MQDARLISENKPVTFEALQATITHETGLDASTVGLIGKVPHAAPQGALPWFNSLSGQSVNLRPNDVARVGIKEASFEDRFVLDNALQISELMGFAENKKFTRPNSINDLINSPMGSNRQAANCTKIFRDILTGFKDDLTVFQGNIIQSLDFSEKEKTVFEDLWDWAEANFNYSLCITDTDSHDDERNGLHLRIDNQIGGSLVGLNASSFRGSLLHLGKAVSCFGSLMCDVAYKSSTLGMLDDGYPYYDFAEFLDHISVEDQRKILTMYDSFGNFNIDEIEEFIGSSLSEVSDMLEDYIGTGWGYNLIEFLQAREELLGEWRMDHNSKLTINENLSGIEKLLGDWKRTSLVDEHPVYEFLIKAINIFRDNFDLKADKAECWEHGSDQILSSKFVGFGIGQEHDLMAYINESAWNEEEESLIIKTNDIDIVLPFIRNIALAEVLIIALATVFETLNSNYY